MDGDRHAEDRDRKRHKRRYGHTTTNPGMRIVMRELARKEREAEDGPHLVPSSAPSRRAVRIKRRRTKQR